MRNGVLRAHLGSVGRQEGEEVFYLIVSKLVVFLVPFLGLFKPFAIAGRFLRLITELVVEVFVQKYLNDDFVFVAVVAQTECAARLFQRINQLFGCLVNTL